MSGSSGMVGFFYGTRVGRFLLKIIMKLHLDRIAVWFLWSRCSRPFVGWFVRKNGIPMEKAEIKSYRSFRDFFVREKKDLTFDPEAKHLISPCDGWLSAFPIDEKSTFSIKHSHYQIKDFLQDEALAKKYIGGTCLIFRLCVSNYHHYCYIDNGFQGENHPIPGVLHSVQPIACETYPVFVLNKRSWCLMETENFGPVVQCEIGALVVGGIVNELENAPIHKGCEKGRFELAGSTIIVLVEKDRMQLKPELIEGLSQAEEVQVHLGQWIGTAE